MQQWLKNKSVGLRRGLVLKQPWRQTDRHVCTTGTAKYISTCTSAVVLHPLSSRILPQPSAVSRKRGVEVVLVWGAACHEKVQEGLSQSCLASPVHLPSAPGFILDPRVQGSTVSNSPESLGTTEVPITRSSEASLGTANLRPDVPTPTASQTNHSQVSHQKHFCNYTALLNRCLLVTRFLFSAHLFLCLLTSSLLMLL